MSRPSVPTVKSAQQRVDSDELEATLIQVESAVGDQDPSFTIAAKPTARLTRTPALAIALRRLGYAIGNELGRGGMGSVHEAVQEAFDRQVAVTDLSQIG